MILYKQLKEMTSLAKASDLDKISHIITELTINAMAAAAGGDSYIISYTENLNQPEKDYIFNYFKDHGLKASVYSATDRDAVKVWLEWK